ncbi:MAG: YicC family protein [Gemmatales bacterium]|nr:YicC family protein [Gemmatales bacterium]MDW8386266.1 YicC/YloC family endoribonuclease [Gemmatales bacterium]
MLLSMTGFGDARYHSDDVAVAVELRTVNNRYLKVSVRAAEPYNLLEPEIERVVRHRIRRGTVQVILAVRRQSRPADFRINTVALRTYADQLRAMHKELGLGAEIHLSALLTLPGVVEEPDPLSHQPAEDWPVVEPVLLEALDRLQAMRAEEGRAMEMQLRHLLDDIHRHLEAIRLRAPQVVVEYRDKLHERVAALLREMDIELDRSDLIKEVSVFAERSDVTEEVVRLESHVGQFRDLLREEESPGRKLDFLTQEMFREANTIGSKANDVEIARHVVEIKGAVEKIRELVQNVE